MDNVESAIPVVLNEILEEYGGRISIDGGSDILVSDVNIANAIYKQTERVRTPYGPVIVVAARGLPSEDKSKLPPNATLQPVDNLKFDHHSHAVFGLASEDPKFILQGLKAMLTAMRPKAVAIVISIKLETGKAEGEDGQFTVGLVDKLKYQSKGKVEKLADVLEYAGFEKGKIRSFDKSVQVDGKKVDADVVLAMKWDQLNA